jgi:hypothetical protein
MMLASHSRITIPPETWFLLPLVEELPINRELSQDELLRAVAIMTDHYRWPDMKIDADEFRVRARRLSRPYIRDLVEIVYGDHLNKSGKARWGDKTPPYLQIVPQLAGMFPGARFIYLVRDGRDVTKSFMSLMVYGKSLRQNTIEWRESCRWERKWRRSGYAEQILCVRYEDLIVNPEAVLRGICEFIGEKFEAQMLAWQERVERLVPEREQHVHMKLTRSVSHEDIERWRREMSGGAVFIAEALMGRDLRRLGYSCRFDSPLWRPLLWLTRVYFVVLLPISPFRVLRGLTRMVGLRTQGVSGGRVEEGTLSAANPTGGNRRGPVPRAVEPSKLGWRRFFP